MQLQMGHFQERNNKWRKDLAVTGLSLRGGPHLHVTIVKVCESGLSLVWITNENPETFIYFLSTHCQTKIVLCHRVQHSEWLRKFGLRCSFVCAFGYFCLQQRRRIPFCLLVQLCEYGEAMGNIWWPMLEITIFGMYKSRIFFSRSPVYFYPITEQ